MSLRDKVSIVTGAGVGIGKATAIRLAKRGSTVVIADVDSENGKRVAEELREQGSKAKFHRVDVSQSSQVENLMDRTVEEFGGLDVLVNNAGIYRKGSAVTADEKDWDEIISVNLKSMFLCIKYAVPYMREGGGGSIVNVASEAGIVGIENQVAYNVAKAGAISLTQSSAIDFSSDNIRVNCVAPGTTATPLVKKSLEKEPDPEEARKKLEEVRPMNRLGDPDEIASAIVFLASDDPGYATGTVFSIDGGYTAQ
ncbi:MAG: SDR family NAD(P)-dependent oxidoreductase [Candidatus Bipolaricaulia bacterium]